MDRNIFDTEKCKNLCETDLNILDYIYNHIDEIPDLSIQDLAKKTYVSRTTITRFVRKLDYGSYAEFKVRIADITARAKKTTNYELMELLLLNDSLLDDKTIDTIVDAFVKASRIYLIGSYSLSSLCYFINFKFNYYDYKFYALVNGYEIESLLGDINNPLSSKDICVFLSHTGETPRIVNYAKAMKECGAKIVSVTCSKNNTLANISDTAIFVSNSEIFDKNEMLIGFGSPFLFLLETLFIRYYNTIDIDNSDH